MFVIYINPTYKCKICNILTAVLNLEEKKWKVKMLDAGKIGDSFASLILNLVATRGFFLLSLPAY